MKYQYEKKYKSKNLTRWITDNNITNANNQDLLWTNDIKLKPDIATIIQSWIESTNYIEEDVNKGIKGFRLPQIAALHSIIAHSKIPLKTATVVMPTGTGKTETMMASLISLRCNKLLIAVPSDALREQLFKKFYTLGLLKQFNIISKKALYPSATLLKSKPKDSIELDEILDSSNVIITTMSLLNSLDHHTLKKITSNSSHFFVDEAHHIAAGSWNNIKQKFNENQIIQFTATPFRNDGKRIGGKTIFNFPLKLAQEHGYYKQIDFIPIREYDVDKVDFAIAQKAIDRLKKDLDSGFDHILMARCSTKNRADDIFEIYKKYKDFNPIKIYTGISNRIEVEKNILAKKHQIVVCVDMMGEGFDLPQLKIAAFHDIKKSLPITLQLAGRFTRTNLDQNLGNASFIANIANNKVTEEIENLYAQDADWNLILSNKSSEKINKELDFEHFIEGFNNFKNPEISLQNLRPSLSSVVFKNSDDIWEPLKFVDGYNDFQNADYKYQNYNQENKMLVAITAKKNNLKWGAIKDSYNLDWKLLLIYYSPSKKLIFINSSDNSGTYKEIANSVGGASTELIKGLNVFKTFYGLNRVTLHNVGLREFLGKNISFRMMTGSSVEEALSTSEKRKGEKAFVFGNGYENGVKISHGTSYKGRIWARLNGNLKEFADWCEHIGSKLINPKIDPNQILRETLIPRPICELPNNIPVMIDWNEEIYTQSETSIVFKIDNDEFDLSNCDLLIDKVNNNNEIIIVIETEKNKHTISYTLFKRQDYYDYSYQILNCKTAIIYYKNREISLERFLNSNPFSIWFAEGSALTGNDYIKLTRDILPYDREKLIEWCWDNVNLNCESQGVPPKITDSIQYKSLVKLKPKKYTVIYDDDGKGEIADIVAFIEEDEMITIDLYHLKYAHDGKVSNRIDNLYEVCGQAQKSIQWKFKETNELITHLLRRQTKTKNGITCSRIEKGSEDDIIRIGKKMKYSIPLKFNVYIVQPGISKVNVKNDILILLSVTETYIKEVGGIDLKIICNK